MLTYRFKAYLINNMTQLNLDSNTIKQIFKTALFEVIQENREVFSDLFAEIIENIALERAIEEGEDTESVSREVIFNIFNSKA